jgi:hypothetical protein
MNSVIWGTAAILFLTVLPLGAQQPGQLDPYIAKKSPAVRRLDLYLTAKGHLTTPLELRNEKKGFGIFFGRTWRVEPDGSWTATQTYQNQPRLRGQGKLEKKDLKKLAEALADADALSLPSVGRPVVNPHVVSIAFGPNQAVMTFGVDRRLPVTDPLQAGLSVDARYGAIQTAVMGLIEPHLPADPLPVRLEYPR